MRLFSRLSDRELDDLVAGGVPPDDGDLGALAAFLEDLRRLTPGNLGDGTTARHLAAITDTARRYAEHGDVTRATLRGTSGDRGRSLRPGAGRHLAQPGSRSSVQLKIAAAAGVGALLLTALGGAAYADALPGPVQRTVAELVDRVGVSLPGNDQNDADDGPGDDGEINDLDDGDVEDPDDGEANDLDDGDVDDRDDAEVGDRDDAEVNDRDDADVSELDDGEGGDLDEGSRQEAPNGR